jgi:anti-sigma factor RsiW
MMTDQWTDRLSEYLDGDLAEHEEAALAAHLDTCAACSETLAGLRRVVGGG